MVPLVTTLLLPSLITLSPGLPGLRRAHPLMSADVGVATDTERVKAELMAALEPVDRGFSANAKQRREVEALLGELARLGTPAGKGRLGGDWELIYTDAPDILGLKGGPVASLVRVGQQIDETAGTIENVIEYEPAEWRESRHRISSSANAATPR